MATIVYATSGDEDDTFHAAEAPPAGHAFYPIAPCGLALTGERFDALPEGGKVHTEDTQELGITKKEATKRQDAPEPKTDAPAEPVV